MLSGDVEEGEGKASYLRQYMHVLCYLCYSSCTVVILDLLEASVAAACLLIGSVICQEPDTYIGSSSKRAVNSSTMVQMDKLLQEASSVFRTLVFVSASLKTEDVSEHRVSCVGFTEANMVQ